MKKKYFLILILISLATIFVSCGSDENSHEEDTTTTDSVHVEAALSPLLWRATNDNGQSVYLFGSIHAANEDAYPLPDYVMDAFARTDYLAVEVDIAAILNDLGAQMAFASLFILPEGVALPDIIGEDLFYRATEILEEREEFGGILSQLARVFHPFAFYSLILEVALHEAGLNSEDGIDLFFINEANLLGKPIIELESMEMQASVFANFSNELHIFLIEDSLDLDYGVEALLHLYSIWKTGDEAAFYELTNASEEAMPLHLLEEYNNALMLERDISMTEKIRQFMAYEQKVFIVVGLAHLIGQDSIIYQLRNFGYTIELIN